MRAHQIITETVEEQRDIIKMAQKIISWYKNTVGDMQELVKRRQSLAAQPQVQNDDSELIPDFLRSHAAKYDFDRTSKLNTPIYLRDVVGRNYASETIRGWLSTKPIVIFATEENSTYGIPVSKLQKAGGWWDYTRNLIVVSCIRPQSVYTERTLSTLVHEIQHGLDFYKSNSLAYVSSKSGRGGSTTRAQQEVTDISIILAAFKKKLRNLPKSGIMVKNIISSAMLQSQIFKNLADAPEFANIKIESPQSVDWENFDVNDTPPQTDIYYLFYWLQHSLLWNGSLEECLNKLQTALVEYRSHQYKMKKGYSDKISNYDKDKSSYYSQNLEINARILQAFNVIVNKLKAAGFRGYSSDPEIYKQQQNIIWKHVEQILKSYIITKELWPKNKQNERWRRLKIRTYQFIKHNFPRTSNALPKNPTRSEFDDDQWMNKLLSNLLGKK